MAVANVLILHDMATKLTKASPAVCGMIYFDTPPFALVLSCTGLLNNKNVNNGIVAEDDFVLNSFQKLWRITFCPCMADSKAVVIVQRVEQREQ